MYKKAYLVPPDLLDAVKQKIPRTVTLQEGYLLILSVGLSKFTSAVLPRFKDKALLEEIVAIRMRLCGAGISMNMHLFFDTKKALDTFAERVKGARDVLRKRYFKGKGFTYHVIISIFRAWLAGCFEVDFSPTV